MRCAFSILVCLAVALSREHYVFLSPCLSLPVNGEFVLGQRPSLTPLMFTVPGRSLRNNERRHLKVADVCGCAAVEIS